MESGDQTSGDAPGPGPKRPLSNPGERGLCSRCSHQRRVQSQRGAVFFLCGLSALDPRYPKYPPQPVVRCDGFAPNRADLFSWG